MKNRRMMAAVPNEEDTCTFNSFASAVCYAGLTEAATEIYDIGQTTYLNIGTPLNCLIEHVRQMRLQFNVVKLNKDQNNLQFLIDSTSAGGEHTISLVLLGCSDGTRNHAVSILNGLIFDSNEFNTMPLCRENIDYCCSDVTGEASFDKVVIAFSSKQMSRSMKKTHP